MKCLQCQLAEVVDWLIHCAHCQTYKGTAFYIQEFLQMVFVTVDIILSILFNFNILVHICVYMHYTNIDKMLRLCYIRCGCYI